MPKRTSIVITGDHTGDIGGTVISGGTGTVHVGNGDIHIGNSQDDQDGGDRTFTGTGMTVIEGDNPSGISRRW